MASPRSASSDANRLFLEKYRALDLAGQFEQSFPSFTETFIKKEYRAWQHQSVAVVACFLTMLALVLPYLVTRYNLAFIGEYENPFTISSQVVAIPTGIAMMLYLLAKVYLVYYDRNPALASDSKAVRRQQQCQQLLNYPIEDVLAIFAACALSTNFLGRVAAGSCPPGTHIWDAQRCNTVAASQSFPQDDVIIMYAMPVCFQLLLRGISLPVALASYCIALASVIYAMVAVGGYLQWYSIQYILIFPIMSVELERWMRVSFVRHKLVVDSRQTAVAAAENETKQVLLAALAAQTAAENAAKIADLGNQAHLAAKEQDMLRHIMGNVAHDMKTPLHSIIAELESVRGAVDDACVAAAVPGADASAVLGHLLTTTHTTLSVVDSMTQFLVMSINRSQDYAKLTTNVALRPHMETVSIPDVLRFVTKCMAHQNNGRIIVVHSLVSSLLWLSLPLPLLLAR